MVGLLMRPTVNEETVNVTITEWIVIIDTLRGSTSIADRRDLPLFNYTRDTRERLAVALTDRLNQIGVHMRVEPIKSMVEIQQEEFNSKAGVPGAG